MTIALTSSDFWELFEDTEAEEIELSPDFYEIEGEIPKLLGKGRYSSIDLCEGIGLWSQTMQSSHAHTCHYSEREHEVEICLWIPHHRCEQDSHYTLFGSGLAPHEVSDSPVNTAGFYLAISFEPDLFQRLYGNSTGELPPALQMLIKPNDWQQCWRDRPVTPSMYAIVQDIQTCLYEGLIKQMYLQGKVFELLALQLEPILVDRVTRLNYGLTAKTIERVYQARDILVADLEHPPLVLELAEIVDVSDRTLQRGFKKLFGTSVFGYLSDRRLEKAEQLLRQSMLTVANVAAIAGYSNPGHFAAAFKRKFGITPSECLAGQKSVSR
jgi:AraC-like DNA-binding protein